MQASDDGKICVLDHGVIRLVASMGSDLSIARAARVSYDAAWRAGEDEGSDARLIRYMLAHGHSTPFEHVSFTFEITAPIFIFRQWHRYRAGWSFNEVSGRYSELPELFYVPKPEHIGVQSKGDKQLRVMDANAVVFEEDWLLSEHMRVACEKAFECYHELLKRGVPRELARTVLPLATYSKMFATTNLRALFHFLEQRLDPHAQFEIRQYAQAIETLIEPIVPVAFAAWKEGRKGNV